MNAGSFLFQLTAAERDRLTSQIAISKPGRGGRRTLPYAFTPQVFTKLDQAVRLEPLGLDLALSAIYEGITS